MAENQEIEAMRIEINRLSSQERERLIEIMPEIRAAWQNAPEGASALDRHAAMKTKLKELGIAEPSEAFSKAAGWAASFPDKSQNAQLADEHLLAITKYGEHGVWNPQEFRDRWDVIKRQDAAELEPVKTGLAELSAGHMEVLSESLPDLKGKYAALLEAGRTLEKLEKDPVTIGAPRLDARVALNEAEKAYRDELRMLGLYENADSVAGGAVKLKGDQISQFDAHLRDTLEARKSAWRNHPLTSEETQKIASAGEEAAKWPKELKTSLARFQNFEYGNLKDRLNIYLDSLAHAKPEEYMAKREAMLNEVVEGTNFHLKKELAAIFSGMTESQDGLKQALEASRHDRIAAEIKENVAKRAEAAWGNVKGSGSSAAVHLENLRLEHGHLPHEHQRYLLDHLPEIEEGNKAVLKAQQAYVSEGNPETGRALADALNSQKFLRKGLVEGRPEPHLMSGLSHDIERAQKLNTESMAEFKGMLEQTIAAHVPVTTAEPVAVALPPVVTEIPAKEAVKGEFATLQKGEKEALLEALDRIRNGGTAPEAEHQLEKQLGIAGDSTYGKVLAKIQSLPDADRYEIHKEIADELKKPFALDASMEKPAAKLDDKVIPEAPTKPVAETPAAKPPVAAESAAKAGEKTERTWVSKLFKNAEGEIHGGKAAAWVAGTAAAGLGIYALTHSQKEEGREPSPSPAENTR